MGCASRPPSCPGLELQEGWVRLPSQPEFVDASTYTEMYPRGVPADVEAFAWYANSSGRVAACLPGNSVGCGEFVSYFTGSELEDLAEITVCGEGKIQ